MSHDLREIDKNYYLIVVLVEGQDCELVERWLQKFPPLSVKTMGYHYCYIRDFCETYPTHGICVDVEMFEKLLNESENVLQRWIL